MKKYDTEEEKLDFNEYGVNIDGLSKDGLNINGLDKNGYNINGIDKNGVDKNGLNINGIEGNRTKYPKRRIIWTYNEGVYYDQYGFDEKGFRKDGYDIYGFDENGLNKDGLNKYGYKKSSAKGLNISSLLILLSKIYTNNSSKELLNEIKKTSKKFVQE